MRYKTATVLSVLMVAGLFALPMAVQTIVYSYAGRGVEIPSAENSLLRMAYNFASYRWIIAPFFVVTSFLFAALTDEWRLRKRKHYHSSEHP